jgi:hypothetical protein
MVLRAAAARRCRRECRREAWGFDAPFAQLLARKLWVLLASFILVVVRHAWNSGCQLSGQGRRHTGQLATTLTTVLPRAPPHAKPVQQLRSGLFRPPCGVGQCP